MKKYFIFCDCCETEMPHFQRGKLRPGVRPGQLGCHQSGGNSGREGREDTIAESQDQLGSHLLTQEH